MPKYLFLPAILLACGVALPGIAQAQQAPAASSPQSNSTRTHSSSGTTARRTPARNTLSLTTQKAKNSYALGLNIGNSLHRQSIDIDPAILERGLKDALSGAKPLLTDAEVQTTLTALQTQMRAALEQKMQAEMATNKKAGDAFLAENRTKPGVVVLPSGLQYKILQEGTGPKPKLGDMIIFNYRGMLVDGKEFDSSYKRGQPAIVQVGRVIKGFNEALQLMPTGSKWELYIPSDLAYGDRPAGPDIGPGSTLIFDVELVSIKPPNPASSPFGTPHITPPPSPQGAAQTPTTAKPTGTP